MAFRATMSATHQGSFMGIPPTGKRVEISGIEYFRLANGKIVERWVMFDDLGLMEQLGVVPAKEQLGFWTYGRKELPGR